MSDNSKFVTGKELNQLLNLAYSIADSKDYPRSVLFYLLAHCLCATSIKHGLEKDAGLVRFFNCWDLVTAENITLAALKKARKRGAK